MGRAIHVGLLRLGGPVDDASHNRRTADKVVFMDAVVALTRLGGIARAGELLRLTTRRRLRSAVAAGTVLRAARGSYHLPNSVAACARAAEISGTVCLRSAAAVHGWKLKIQPELPEVAVRRRRKVTEAMREGTAIHYLELAPDEVDRGVTSVSRTLVDCARLLPFDEALAIVDSALRCEAVTPDTLQWIHVQGAGATRVRRVFGAADGRAANPFESVLRALCLAAGLDVVPQQWVVTEWGEVRPDLVDGSRSLVVEAESFAHHGDQASYRKDITRYTWLVDAGWRVLRFTWHQVMFQQDYVLRVLRRAASEVAA